MEFWRNLKRVNISGQDLEQVITRHGLGAADISASGVINTANGVETTLESYTGSGYLMMFFCETSGGANSHTCMARVKIDGVYLTPDETFQDLQVFGFSAQTEPIKLIKYQANGNNGITWYFNPPLAFDTELKLTFYNLSGANLPVRASWVYSKL